VAVVKTGGFDTVFNENSKRKTFNAVSLKKDGDKMERLIGDGAAAVVPRTLPPVLKPDKASHRTCLRRKLATQRTCSLE
jgi:hypothetical protein